MKLTNIFVSLLAIICGNCITNVYPTEINQNSTFLIIGTSVPSVIAGWILSRYNVNVTMSFETATIDNYMSTTRTTVDDVTFELPKMQPVIFENSLQVQVLVNQLRKNLQEENSFELHFQKKQKFWVSNSESMNSFAKNLVNAGCLKKNEISQLLPFISAVQNYNYDSYRLKYSNITLAQFAKLMKSPESFMDCAINLFTIGSGMTKDNFNAADALARIYFYYLQKPYPLRSYFVLSHSYFKSYKGLIDQMIDDMIAKNVKFISNHVTNGLYVDARKGKILGDLSDKSKIYDFVILGDTFSNTKRILQNTHDENTGAPNIFKPLEVVLGSLNKYSPSTDVASVKIWLSEKLHFKPHFIQINDSPYPYSIQSIKQLTMVTYLHHWDAILEVIVVGTNGTKVLDWDKVYNELVVYLPSIKGVGIKARRVDWIDMGVLMNTDYGSNRLLTSSVQAAGISNLILAGDWLEPRNKTAFDLERGCFLAMDALVGMTFD